MEPYAALHNVPTLSTVNMGGSIFISGAPGSGKTSLANILGTDLTCEVIEERLDHPLVKAYFDDPKRWSFHLSTLLMLQSIEALDQHAIVGRDQWLCWDYDPRSHFEVFCHQLFANDRLSAHELALSESLHRALLRRYREPDLLVFLRADASVLQTRLAIRNRDRETQTLSSEYLAQLVTRFEKWKDEREGNPLIIDTTAFDIVNSDSDRATVIALVRERLQFLKR